MLFDAKKVQEQQRENIKALTGTTLKTCETFRVKERLTVVTQQQTRLAVFIHINGCYKIYLQAGTSQLSFERIHFYYCNLSGYSLKGETTEAE